MREYRASRRLHRVRAGDALVVVDGRTGASRVLDAAGAALLAELADWTTADAIAAAHVAAVGDPDGVEALAEQVETTLEGFHAIRLVDRR